jgi:hypothetical protein
MESSEYLERALKNFILPRNSVDQILTIYCDRQSILSVTDMSLGDFKEFLAEETTPLAIDLYKRISAGVTGNELFNLNESATYCEAKRAEFLAAGKLNPAPLLTAKDLLANGFTPGPKIKTALDRVRRAQLNEDFDTREAALELARDVLGE